MITGNKRLGPATRIEVWQGLTAVYEVHTCYNSIAFPPGWATESAERTEENLRREFFAGLDATMAGDDYNTQ